MFRFKRGPAARRPVPTRPLALTRLEPREMPAAMFAPVHFRDARPPTPHVVLADETPTPAPVATTPDAIVGSGSAATAAATTPPATTDPSLPRQDWSHVTRLDQGEQNSCGPTSLTMALNFLSRGDNYSQPDIDSQIRRVNAFGTNPADLVRYAESKGFNGGMYNKSTLSEMMGYLSDPDHVVIACLNDPYDKGRDTPIIDTKDHYIIVTGLERDGGSEYVWVRDPNGDDVPSPFKTDATKDSSDYRIPFDTFMEKWGPDTDDGYDNFMVVVANGDQRLPPDRLDGAGHSNAIAAGYWNLLNNGDRVVDPDDAGVEMHGVLATYPAAVGGVITGAGWLVTAGGEGLRDVAKKLPPGLSNAVGYYGSALKGAGAIVSAAGEGISDAGDAVGRAAEDLANARVAKAAGDVVSAGAAVYAGAAKAATGWLAASAEPLGDLGHTLQGVNDKVPLSSVIQAGGAVMSAASAGVQSLADGAVSAVERAGQAASDIVSLQIADGVKDAGRAATAVGDAVAQAARPLGDAAGQAAVAVGTTARDGAEAVASAAGWAADAAHSGLVKLTPVVVSAATDVVHTVEQAPAAVGRAAFVTASAGAGAVLTAGRLALSMGESGVGAAIMAAKAVAHDTSAAAGAVTGAVADAAGAVAGAVADAASTVAGAVADAASTVGNAVGSAVDDIEDWF